MIPELHDFLNNNFLDFEDALSERTMDELSQATDTSELKARLVNFEPGKYKSVLELIAFHPKGKPLLSIIQRHLSSVDWYELISLQNSLQNQSLINRFFLKSCQPSWLFELITKNLPNPGALVSILTTNFKPHSLATSRYISIEKLLEPLSELDDIEKEKVIFSLIQLENRTYSVFDKALNEGKLHLLKNIATSDDLKNRIDTENAAFLKRKKSVHFLGISDEIANSKRYGKKKNKDLTVIKKTYEGHSNTQSLSDFNEVLSTFSPNSEYNAQFQSIKNAYGEIDLYEPISTQANHLIQYYEDNHFVIIPSGWLGHSITLAVSEGYLIVGNRGTGKDPRGGCVIYQLEKPITKQALEKLLDKDKQESRENYFSTINDLVRKDNDNKPIPFHIFPLKQQKYGTCSIANKKAVMAGIYALLKAKEYNKDNPVITDEIVSESMEEYKRFTQHTRMLTLFELINECEKNPAQRHMLTEGLIDYADQHYKISSPFHAKLLHNLIIQVPMEMRGRLLNSVDVVTRITLKYLYKNGDNNIPEFILKLDNSYRFDKIHDFKSLREYLQSDSPEDFDDLMNAYINANPDLNLTKLMIAVRFQDDDYIERLIHDDSVLATINHYGIFGRSALSWALINKRSDLFSILIEKGAKLTTNNEMLDPLMLALKGKDLDFLKYLIQKDPTIIYNMAKGAVKYKYTELISYIFDSHPGLDSDQINILLCLSYDIAVSKMLIENGADVNYHSMKQNSPILTCCKNGNLELLKYYISQGADPNLNISVLDFVGSEYEWNSEIILELINAGAHQTDDGKRLTPLIFKACSIPDEVIFNLLIEKEDPNIRNNQGVMLLISAVKLGHAGIVKILLSRDPSLVNQRGVFGESPLSHALLLDSDEIALEILKYQSMVSKDMLLIAAKKNHVNLIKACISKGADVHYQNYMHETPLMLAVEFGNLGIVEELLNQGANVNVANMLGNTPLKMAIMKGHNDIASFLIDKGADVNARDSGGKAVVSYLIGSDINLDLINKIVDKSEAIPDNLILYFAQKCPKYLDVLKRVIENKNRNELDIKDIYGSSLFMVALESRNDFLLGVLIDKEVSCDGQNNLGTTTLHIAAKYPDLEMVEYLISKGASVDKADNMGFTPLFYALYSEVLEHLIKNGADLYHRNNDGLSVLDYFFSVKNINGMMMLIKHSEPNQLFNEFNKGVNLELLNGLPNTIRKKVIDALGDKLTSEQMVSLALHQDKTTRPKSIIHSRPSVSELIKTHETKIAPESESVNQNTRTRFKKSDPI